MKPFTEQKFIILILSILVLLVGVGYIISIDKQGDNYTISAEKKEDTQVEKEEPLKEDKDKTEKEEPIKIMVHVTGAVVNPDQLYELEQGSRVQDAINMAGGAREDVDYTYINLAAFLKDGAKIYIPSKNDDYLEIQHLIWDNIKNEGDNSLININIASKIELMALKGVGKATAEAIVSYREKHGPYTKEEDIQNVKGIGQATYEDLKDKICVK